LEGLEAVDKKKIATKKKETRATGGVSFQQDSLSVSSRGWGFWFKQIKRASIPFR